MKPSADPFGRSPLRIALQEGDLKRVRSLVEASADLHYRDSDGYDALIDASFGNHKTLLPVLGELPEGVDLRIQMFPSTTAPVGEVVAARHFGRQIASGRG